MQNLAEEIDLYFGSTNTIVSSSLRGFIKAPEGKKFIVCDFAAIEARVLAWLANELGMLEAFRTHGKLYEQQAAIIFGVDIDDVTPSQRQTAKHAVLACGYQGGVGAFRNIEKTLMVDMELTDEQVKDIVTKWRLANKKIKAFWNDCNNSASLAVKHPGTVFKVNDKIAFVKKGSFLWCRLPSGRTLKYPYPFLKPKETPWGTIVQELRFKGINAISKKWERQSTYGGKLTENICQAVARDLLVEAMFALEDEGYPIIFHVHDEIVCEIDEDFGSVAEVEKIMCIVPDWAKGLPLAATGYEAKRFRK